MEGKKSARGKKRGKGLWPEPSRGNGKNLAAGARRATLRAPDGKKEISIIVSDGKPESLSP